MVKILLDFDSYWELISNLSEKNIIKPTDRVLLLGCINKQICSAIASLVEQGHVVAAYDTSDLTLLNKQSYDLINTNLGYISMGLQNIFFTNQYDIVIYFHRHSSLLEQTNIFFRIGNALVPHGKFVLFSPLLNKLDILAELTAIQPKWRKRFGAIKLTEHLLTYQEHLALLDQTGFRLEHAEKIDTPLRFHTPASMDFFVLNCLPQIKKLSKTLQAEFINDLTIGFLMNFSDKASIPFNIPILQAISGKNM